MRVGVLSAWSAARISSTRCPDVSCSSIMLSRPRALWESSTPRSWKSSTITTSARSRRASRFKPRSTPVGSTATLVIERFRLNGMEPSPATAMLLLGAVLSDTVILNSPTTTERDHAVIAYLEQILACDARDFGQEMFERTTDLTHVPAEEIVGRDVKQYD